MTMDQGGLSGVVATSGEVLTVDPHLPAIIFVLNPLVS